MRDSAGRRLYNPEAVEAFARTREALAQQRNTAPGGNRDAG